jgi:hypothetical protein
MNFQPVKVIKEQKTIFILLLAGVVFIIMALIILKINVFSALSFSIPASENNIFNITSLRMVSF